MLQYEIKWLIWFSGRVSGCANTSNALGIPLGNVHGYGYAWPPPLVWRGKMAPPPPTRASLLALISIVDQIQKL